MNPELEARFRGWAFRIFYTRTYRHVTDPLRRFGKALEASSREIVRPELLKEWERLYGARKSPKPVVACRHEAPKIPLAPGSTEELWGNGRDCA